MVANPGLTAKPQEPSGTGDEHLPKPDQLVVISDGVFEGDIVEGVRYPSPQHMSGRWLTTDRYNGDIKSLRTVHFHHVTESRPDLMGFLKLPFGYRFFSGDAWFDQKVADSEP
jgi:hypothetical protein